MFDSPRVRFRSSGTSPASPASSASAPAKDADDASDAGDVARAGEGNEGGKGGKDLNSESGSQGGKGEDLGKKCLKGERGEKIFGRKREIFPRGEQALRGNGGTGSHTGKGEKDFGNRRVEKALGGKRGKGS